MLYELIKRNTNCAFPLFSVLGAYSLLYGARILIIQLRDNEQINLIKYLILQANILLIRYLQSNFPYFHPPDE